MFNLISIGGNEQEMQKNEADATIRISTATTGINNNSINNLDTNCTQSNVKVPLAKT